MKKHLPLFFFFVLVALVVVPPSAPLNVSYVYSDSMEPTIDTNDGYVLVPATDVQTGDIVTFWAPQKSEYVTHRVVGSSPEGFTTKGDNNPTIDQRGGYSYVDQEDIVGEVLTYSGSPVVIPGLGVLIGFLRSNTVLLLAVGLALALFERSSSQYTRRLPRARHFLLPMLLLAVLLMATFPLIGASAVERTFVVTNGPTDSPTTLAPGESETFTTAFNRSQNPLTHTIVSVEGATVLDQSRDGSQISTTARIAAPNRIGPQRVAFSVHSYPALLPRDLLTTLQTVHPVAASSTLALVATLPTAALTMLFVDGKALTRDRHRSRPQREQP